MDQPGPEGQTLCGPSEEVPRGSIETGSRSGARGGRGRAGEGPVFDGDGVSWADAELCPVMGNGW